MKHYALALFLILTCVGCLGDKVDTVRYVNHYRQDVVLRYYITKETFATIKPGDYFDSGKFGDIPALEILDIRGNRLGRVVTGDYKADKTKGTDWIVDLGP